MAFYWWEFAKVLFNFSENHNLNNYTPYENCSSSSNQNHCMVKIPLVCKHVTQYAVFTTSHALKMEPPSIINKCTIHLSSNNGFAEFWPEPMTFLGEMINHAHLLELPIQYRSDYVSSPKVGCWQGNWFTLQQTWLPHTTELFVF